MDNSTPTQSWRVTGRSVRGALHVKQDLPNQDAIRWRTGPDDQSPIVLTVADGHGSQRSFRSALGSAFAVDTLAELLLQFYEEQKNPGDIGAVLNNAKNFLPSELETRWNTCVNNHLEIHPFTSEEKDRLKRDGSNEPGAVNDALAYGTTALGVLLTDDLLIQLQLGDGDIMNVLDSGEVHRPLPADARLLGNETTSLCTPGCAEDVRLTVSNPAQNGLHLVLVSTDGYSNSFKDDTDFLRVGSDLQEFFKTDGWDPVTANLEDWLHQASREGSGDDITLGLVCRMERAVQQPAVSDILTLTRALAASD